MTFPIWGNENVVRQGTGSYLDNNATAMLPNGGYVVAWHSLGERKLYLQIYDGEGRKVADQHSINGSVGAEQNIASAMSIGNDGSFAITWNESFGAADSFTIKTRVYNADGTPKTAEAVSVATGLSSDRTSTPKMVKTSQGFATVYDADDNIAVAYHDLNGNVTRTINFGHIEGAMSPDVTTLANGNLVISYSSEGNLYFRIVDGSGNVGVQQAAGAGVHSNVVSTGGGDFAVVNGLSSGSINIRFYRDGALSGPVEIARGTGDTGFFQATELSSGRVAIVYIAGNGADTADVYLRVVDANGTMSAPMLINNTVSDGNQRQALPSISEMLDGRLAVTWNDQDVAWGNITTQIIDPRVAPVTVGGTQENDIYAGSAFDGNILNGYGGNDKFFAGAGSDRFDGGEGIDTVTYERSGAGVIVSLDSGGRNADARGDAYTSIEKLVGSARADNLTGDAANNTIEGGAGDDTLSGGGGVDVLVGGQGDDTFFVDGNTTVIEATGAGYDTVYAMSSFALQEGSAVEVIYANGVGNLNLIGNSFANKIIGNESSNHIDGRGGNDYLYGGSGGDRLDGGDGDDLLDGQGGADVMSGGSGNDTYLVDDIGDQVLDYRGAGKDTVYSSVSFSLNAAAEIEALIALGTSGLKLTGNGYANTITGNAGANALHGREGHDRLIGGAGHDKFWGGLGNDTLTGGSGKDIFVFDAKPHKSTNKDRIVDFNVRDDGIWLENKVFKNLGKAGSEKKPAQLKKDFFTIGSKAKDRNDHLVYDNKKGVLYYDADGSGRGKAVEIATLSKKLKLTHKDFFVI